VRLNTLTARLERRKLFRHCVDCLEKPKYFGGLMVDAGSCPFTQRVRDRQSMGCSYLAVEGKRIEE